MTPNPMGPSSPTASYQSGSPALYNQISSMGAQTDSAESEESAQPVGQDTQSTKLTNRFTMLFNSFKDLAKEFPGGESDVNTVQNALASWLQKAQASVNESSAGSSGY